MSKVLTYAGVMTKLASMASRFLKKSDYVALINRKSVPEITAYLQKTSMYSQALKDVNAEELHRRDLETILKSDLVKDVLKIFTFFVALNRAFSSYIIKMYEIENLKLALRNALIERESKKKLEELKTKFYDLGTKATVDPLKIATCSTKEEILSSLEKTPYYEIVRNVFASYKAESRNLIGSIENGLDRWLYFGFLNAAKNLDYDDYFNVKIMMGERIDLTNLEWIIRAKAFYSLRAEELYNSLIPMGLHLNSTHLHRLCDAKDLLSTLGVISEGPYANLLKDISEKRDQITPEMLTLLMKRYLYSSAKKAVSTLGGYSITPFFHYMFLKEYEIMDITTIIEGVRYNLSEEEIKKFLINEALR